MRGDLRGKLSTISAQRIGKFWEVRIFLFRIVNDEFVGKVIKTKKIVVNDDC